MFALLTFRESSATQACIAVACLRLAAAIGLCFALIAATTTTAPTQVTQSARPNWDPARFLLNAFLVPALEQDAVPLRWFDPRAKLHCGPNTTVRVNGQPLVAGAAVPIQPFEVAWQVHDCRPFGFDGPRFNGGVKLTVYREEWGFSAGIVPAALRYTWPNGETQEVQVRSGTTPLFPQADDPD
jgi:hypothetical protein